MLADVTHGVELVPWQTNLSGALVEYQPSRGHNHHQRQGLPAGSRGLVLCVEWVSNYTMGTTACFHNVLWFDHGESKSMNSLAHFLDRDIRVLALAEEAT